jgi:hypothetical protein
VIKNLTLLFCISRHIEYKQLLNQKKITKKLFSWLIATLHIKVLKRPKNANKNFNQRQFLLFPEQKKTGDIYLVQQAGRVWPDSILLQNQKN